MEKENIITVDIEDFKDSQHVLDYIDDDFAIVNSLEGARYYRLPFTVCHSMHPRQP